MVAAGLVSLVRAPHMLMVVPSGMTKSTMCGGSFSLSLQHMSVTAPRPEAGNRGGRRGAGGGSARETNFCGHSGMYGGHCPWDWTAKWRVAQRRFKQRCPRTWHRGTAAVRGENSSHCRRCACVMCSA